MKKKIFISLLISLLFLSACTSHPKEIHNISLKALRMELLVNQNIQLIDVRKPKEYRAGHIDDAVNINISDRSAFKKVAEKLDKNQPVYVYCKAGVRSNKASKLLQKMGFTSIYDYSGGWDKWSQQ